MRTIPNGNSSKQFMSWCKNGIKILKNCNNKCFHGMRGLELPWMLGRSNNFSTMAVNTDDGLDRDVTNNVRTQMSTLERMHVHATKSNPYGGADGEINAMISSINVWLFYRNPFQKHTNRVYIFMLYVAKGV